jgi:putative membrane protein
MLNSLLTFLLHWCVLSVLLWLASKVFHGIQFTTSGALWLSALLLGFANAVIRPLFIVFTFPLTLLTFGFFLLVINALMLLLVAAVVPGFKVSGFWTAFFASLFISALSLLVDMVTSSSVSTVVPAPHGTGTMVEAGAVDLLAPVTALWS